MITFWEGSHGRVESDPIIRSERSAGDGLQHVDSRRLDRDPKKEWFQAMVIAPPADDPTDEDQRLEKGLTRLISLLKEKLNALQSGNES
jgi:hypothetical protein